MFAFKIIVNNLIMPKYEAIRLTVTGIHYFVSGRSNQLADNLADYSGKAINLLLPAKNFIKVSG